MATPSWRELVPHYLALVAIISILVVAMQVVAPWATIWHQTALAVVVGLAYPLALRYLGMAPSAWE